MSQKIATFIYEISTIFNCRCGNCTTKLHCTFWEKVGINMKEIIIKHNGIEYTEEDIIEMLDLVFSIVGEQV